MTLPVGYFDAMYAASPDPWGFTSRWYERRKYALTLAALPRPRYAAAFEPGCSIGVLTEQLAARCDRLLSVDLAEQAVATAAERVAGCPHVRVRPGRMPQDWPDEDFDLIVLSEVGYYLGDADLDTLLDRAVASLRPGGDLVAVHWRHPVADYPQRGDEVHERLDRVPGLARLVRHEEADFRLDVHTRTPPPARSVAEREGLC
ncbi:class I SAM-dependent DNA methyltransferase [Plantactinospora siamensis]|uniref:Class I SAM-dependent DNA methyltransferase n=1 Tax=Plantactinospora siamensis TaxID=555372 RepID=A0ABV6P3Y0_9ACTN